MQLSDWILGWSDDKSLQIRETLRYLVLTGAKATTWLYRFFCPPCGCFLRIPHSQGTKPLLDETNTFSGWPRARTSWVALALTIQLQRDHLRYYQCRWKCCLDIQWQRYQTSQQGFCWCILGSLLVRWLDQKASVGTWCNHIESWTRFPTYLLFGFSFGDLR